MILYFESLCLTQEIKSHLTVYQLSILNTIEENSMVFLNSGLQDWSFLSLVTIIRKSRSSTLNIPDDRHALPEFNKNQPVQSISIFAFDFNFLLYQILFIIRCNTFLSLCLFNNSKDDLCPASIFLLIVYLFSVHMFLCVCICVHESIQGKVRVQPSRGDSFFTPSKLQGLHQGQQTWQQVPLLTETSQKPCFINIML